MKNKAILIISVLFGIMLIGIVMIQSWWMARIDSLNQKAFNDAINKTLVAVVKQVQEKENFVFIKHELETDTLLRKTKKLLQRHGGHKAPKTETADNVFISVNSESGKETETIVRIEKSKNGEKTVQQRVIVGSGIKATGTPPVPPSAPIPPVPAVMEVPALPEEDRKESVEVIIEKMMGMKNSDSVSIKPAEIEKIIATQLKQNNLPEKFGFALLSKDSKKSFVQLPGDNKDGWTPYRINLYPNDLFGREITLVLFFSQNDVTKGFKEQFLPQILSLFFTLSLLVLFLYSIRMLLRHKKMLAQKNDFINHMSHEFKTPLAGISLGADMLIDKPEKLNDEQIHRIATIIKKQSEHLNKEITGVLLSAQLEENIVGNRSSFNLIDTLKRQLDLSALQIESKNAKVTLNCEAIIAINGDESLWQKVFSNLLDNSLNFSAENPEITVSATKTGNTIKLGFSDNGIGIDQKDVPHIFEKFYRSNYYKQSNIQGFGLGLNFVKKVVDSHKGSIKAESELGKGTKIIIEINV